MFVTSLESTFWAEDEHEAEAIERPAWDDVIPAVQRLNANTHDGVFLNGENGSYVGIIGGRDGKYVVAGKGRDGKSFILTVGSFNGKWITINVGGQENEYADNEVVALETVLTVAKTFFESGECDRRYKWNEKAAKMLAT